jgi:hypothetical protein
MHRYRIITQISLIFSILNLVLAAPMAVPEIHEAHASDDSEIAAAEGVAAMPKKSGELEAASDRPASPPSDPDAMTPPRHSPLSDVSTSSGYSGPDSSSDLSVSGYSWLLDRPPRLSLYPPASSHESTSRHTSNSGLSGLSTPSTPSTPAWLEELEHIIALHMDLDGASTETHSQSEKFTPSRQSSSASSATIPSTKYTSASAGSLTSHYFSAWDGLEASRNPIPDRSPSSPPENAKFLTENMVKKLKIVGGLTAIGAIITGIAAPLIKHRDNQDS